MKFRLTNKPRRSLDAHGKYYFQLTWRSFRDTLLPQTIEKKCDIHKYVTQVKWKIPRLGWDCIDLSLQQKDRLYNVIQINPWNFASTWTYGEPQHGDQIYKIHTSPFGDDSIDLTIRFNYDLLIDLFNRNSTRI